MHPGPIGTFGRSVSGAIGTALICLAAAASGASLSSRALVVGQRVVFQDSVPPSASGAIDLGRSDPDLPLERIVVLLERRSAADLDKFLDDVQDPASSEFHRWLSPDEFGRRFGLADSDLQRVESWLQAEGLTIDEIAAGRGWINVTGTRRVVEAAFQTEIHDFLYEGRVEHANVKPTSVPLELNGLVAQAGPIASFPHPRSGRRRPSPTPDLNFSGMHAMGPADFATIYNTQPLLSGGFDGHGTSVAVVARCNFNMSDVHGFRQDFGLSSNDPVRIVNGADPGIFDRDEEGEVLLDAEWSGAAAPGATIKVVISKSTNSTAGELLSSQYVVDQDIAAIATLSFYGCEARFSSFTPFYLSAWAQAAAEGITICAISGDSGAAGCDSDEASQATQGLGVSHLAATPYNTCVGGTQFDDLASPSLYWSDSQDPVTRRSAKTYIPEVAWNESSPVHGLWSTGGGRSTLFSKPTWQRAPGVPDDGARDVPDVALTAAAHDGYVTMEEGQSLVESGTSASSPAFAGILALVVQKTGSRLGNANPTLYALARAQYGGSGPAVFHDVTQGNNSVPGQEGFECGPGYDPVTGLGSVDAAALADHWSAAVRLPNLLPALPTSWSDKLLITNSSSETADDPLHTTANSLFARWAVSNNGNASTPGKYEVDLKIDGVSVVPPQSSPGSSLAPGHVDMFPAVSLGMYPAGHHTAILTINPAENPAESDYSDNSYTRTFDVYPVGKLANFAPFRPSGWSGPLVVTKQAGSTTEATSFSTSDDLFLDWSFINSGSTAALSRTYFYLFVDGIFFDYFYFEPPLANNTYFYWQDEELGHAPAGSHSFEMTADSTDAIPESDENDNTTSLTIQVAAPPRHASAISTGHLATIHRRP